MQRILPPEPIELEVPLPLFFDEVWHEYDDVYTFSFTTNENIPYIAGQNARVVIPSLSEPDDRRSLSFASAPHEKQILFSMHTDSGSPYKKACLNLTEGDEVHIIKIKGKTVLPKQDGCELVFIAGGVGITPFRSLLKEIAQYGKAFDTTLLHVSSGNYLFENELTALASTYTKCTRQEIASSLSHITITRPNALYYVVGSEGFLDTLEKLLLEQNIEGGQLSISRFTGYEAFDA